MVGKLMKHELFALLRTLVIFAAVVVMLAILTRITYAIGGAESVLFTLLYLFFELCAMLLIIVPVIVSAERFYKSLFTGEGYLTFSLPATAAQLIWAKLLSALIFCASCIVVSVVCFFIATPWGDAAFQSLPDTFVGLYELFIADPLVSFEFILYLLLSIPSGFFYLYLIPSIGQLFTKRRKLVTIGLYFGVSFILSYVYVAVMSALQLSNVHAILWTFIGIYSAFDVASFFLIRYILTHRVNLIMG